MICGVFISTRLDDVVYCMECCEFRPSVLVQLNLNEYGKIQFKSFIKCSDCSSKNVRNLDVKTGKLSRTKT